MAKEEHVIAKWATGDTVRIIHGPYTDSTGTIQSIDAFGEQIQVVISLDTGDTRVTLGVHDIEKD